MLEVDILTYITKVKNDTKVLNMLITSILKAPQSIPATKLYRYIILALRYNLDPNMYIDNFHIFYVICQILNNKSILYDLYHLFIIKGMNIALPCSKTKKRPLYMYINTTRFLHMQRKFIPSKKMINALVNDKVGVSKNIYALFLDTPELICDDITEFEVYSAIIQYADKVWTHIAKDITLTKTHYNTALRCLNTHVLSDVSPNIVHVAREMINFVIKNITVPNAYVALYDIASKLSDLALSDIKHLPSEIQEKCISTYRIPLYTSNKAYRLRIAQMLECSIDKLDEYITKIKANTNFITTFTTLQRDRLNARTTSLFDNVTVANITTIAGTSIYEFNASEIIDMREGDSIYYFHREEITQLLKTRINPYTTIQLTDTFLQRISLIQVQKAIPISYVVGEIMTNCRILT